MTAKQLADKTADAYSRGYYRSWVACAAMLKKRGYSDAEVEAILRSKWMRWASDSSRRYPASSKDVERFLDDPRNGCTKEKVQGLVEGTF